MQEVPVGVVIVTRGRPERLANLLRDLRLQRKAPARIVVVDDTDPPVPWDREFPDLPLMVIRPERRLFISRAKNLGAAQVDAPYVAFIDDDNRLPPQLLAELATTLDNAPRCGAVMPGVLYHRQPALVWVYATPFRPDRWGFTLVGRNRLRQPQLEGRLLETDALPNLSMVRSSAFQELNGFDESLPLNSSADLCQRLKTIGWHVYANTGVLTAHDVELPETRGYWAEHEVGDPARARLEVMDWFRFHRRWNGDRVFFAARASYHALGFLIPVMLAAIWRPDGRASAILAALARGYLDGLRGPPARALTG